MTLSSSRCEYLTDAQEELLPVIRDRWLEIGLKTGPCDRAAAEAAIPAVYGAAGLSSPSTIIWLNSPMAGCVGAYVLAQTNKQVRDKVHGKVYTQVSEQVFDQMDEQVDEQIRKQVRDRVRGQVGGQIRDRVTDRVRVQVWNQVARPVVNQIFDQVFDQMSEQMDKQMGRQMWRAGYGQHDASWLAFHDFFSQIPEMKELVAPLSGLIELSRNCGWWWPFKNTIILTERPISLYRDDRHRLHAEDKITIQYPDGWGVYAWHGVRQCSRDAA